MRTIKSIAAFVGFLILLGFATAATSGAVSVEAGISFVLGIVAGICFAVTSKLRIR